MKSKHCICGEKIAYSIFNSYRICDTVSHKSTIAALCYRSAIAKQLTSWHNRLRSCLFSIIIIYSNSDFVNRNSESFKICTKLFDFRQLCTFFNSYFSSSSYIHYIGFCIGCCKIQHWDGLRYIPLDNVCKDEADFSHLLKMC